MIFNEIPQTRVPGQYVEFAVSNLRGGLSTLNYKALLINQGTDAGSKAAKTLVKISNADQAGAFFGFGSGLHLAAKSFYRNNSISEVWAIAVTMDALATPTDKAVGSIQITGAATAAGTIKLYVSGRRIEVSVASGDAVATIAAAIAAKINGGDYPDLPVVTTVATDTVTFTAKNLGLEGNDINIRTNYYEGEVDPAGVTYTITAMTGGLNTPSILDGTPSVITQLGDIWFQIVHMPYTDDTNWNALRDELDRRFGPTTQIDGVAFTAKADTVANLVTFGVGKNTKQISAMGLYAVPTTPNEFSAAVCGQVAQALAAGNGSEARPFQTLELKGVLPPSEGSRFLFSEQDSLLKNGISTFTVDSAGVVRIQRLITTYQKNESGGADATWLDVNTRFTAMFIRYDWVTLLKSKYPRTKLAGDTSNVGPGQAIITPKLAKAEAISRFSEWEAAGLVEDLEFFKANLIVERDPTDVNALNWFLPTDFVNQFRVGKTQIGVIL